MEHNITSLSVLLLKLTTGLRAILLHALINDKSFCFSLQVKLNPGPQHLQYVDIHHLDHFWRFQHNLVGIVKQLCPNGVPDSVPPSTQFGSSVENVNFASHWLSGDKKKAVCQIIVYLGRCIIAYLSFLIPFS